MRLWAKHRFTFVHDIKVRFVWSADTGNEVVITSVGWWQECGESCMGDADCAAQCMHKKDGYSDSCVVRAHI